MVTLYAPVPHSVLDVVRCQQTLELLSFSEAGLYSPASAITYPIRDGLVFMGYDVHQHAFMEAVINEEREHQTSPEYFNRDLKFLRHSSVAVVDIINLLRRVQPFKTGMRALEVAAGSGWVNWFFAQAGYDTWLCELQPNSLFVSWLYDHPNIGPGKRVVADATLVPFGDHTFDLVVCKEFAHHVKAKARLFSEVNRVLKQGGILVLFEPVRSLWATLHYLRSPDPHTDHCIVWQAQYLKTIRRHGFRIVCDGAYAYERSGRLALLRRCRQACVESVRTGTPRNDLCTGFFQYLFGESLIVFASKEDDIPRHPRPRIQVVNPCQLRLTTADREVYRPFVKVIRQAARGIIGEPAPT